ncbi:unnamed protein product [Dibothriocephalus latus]|uniref:C3H1-type domain-containing protein n=1 Tax=Dibothriocephalus latus TaxID=60516 RepID=A0A3P7QM18_DIBLA|nr:unnamed protein product [Dibothriocephalus latus]
MPPKKNEPSKKAVDKEKKKIIEDKTFGLKNKKGAKQQKFVQQVQKQVIYGNKSAKDGTCTKGEKCKFSHDLNIERKTEKKNLYEDERGDMEQWDQAELEDVITKKHGAQNKGLPATTIICKYFLDAVEGNKYGWFWECPNGAACHYRHALPPNFVLRKDKKKMDEQKETITLDELIETEVMLRCYLKFFLNFRA